MAGFADVWREVEEYVLLPATGLRGATLIEDAFLRRFDGARSTSASRTLSATDFLGPVAERVQGRLGRAISDFSLGRAELSGPAEPEVEVVDSAQDSGPKLVRMTPSVAAVLSVSGLRAVPVQRYQPADPFSAAPAHEPTGPPMVLTVRDGAGVGVRDARVVAYVDLAGGVGGAGVTDGQGRVRLQLGGARARVESLYIDAGPGFWPCRRAAMDLADGEAVVLKALGEFPADAVRERYGEADVGAGAGVRVAVVDTGVGPHPALPLYGGRNTVTGQDRRLIQDNGDGHGTHVAGIIAGRAGHGGPAGVAPGAELWSGRVYAAAGPGPGATNYAIMKAMILAADAECDLVNLSLASQRNDDVLAEAVADAVEQGMVVLAAAGNRGVQGLEMPARSRDAVAVTAFGRAASLPPETPFAGQLGRAGDGGAAFATFSNWGRGVRLTAPGVGVISAALGNGYEVRSGTSMACAAATGMTARLLSGRADILAMPRDADRSRAIQNLIQENAAPLNLGMAYEGDGCL